MLVRWRAGSTVTSDGDLPGVERDDAIDARQIVLRRHGAVEEHAPAHLADVDAGQAREQRLELGADRLRRARIDVDVDGLLLTAAVDEQQRRRAGPHGADHHAPSIVGGLDLDDPRRLGEVRQRPPS